LKLSQRPDHYKALGVPRDADTRQVKSAYRELAKQYHPDKVQGSAEDKAASEARFRDIAAAYEVLSDEERRGAYDRGEDMDQQQHPGGGPFGGHPMHFQQGGQTFTFHFG
jgi:DnaJ homolog subfamily C member 3